MAYSKLIFRLIDHFSKCKAKKTVVRETNSDGRAEGGRSQFPSISGFMVVFSFVIEKSSGLKFFIIFDRFLSWLWARTFEDITSSSILLSSSPFIRGSLRGGAKFTAGAATTHRVRQVQQSPCQISSSFGFSEVSLVKILMHVRIQKHLRNHAQNTTNPVISLVVSLWGQKLSDLEKFSRNLIIVRWKKFRKKSYTNRQFASPLF